MTDRNTLNLKRARRPVLESLRELGVINRELIGLGKIIRATGFVESFGYDIEDVHDFLWDEPSLSNFRVDSRWLVKGLTSYRGGRAEILATTSDPLAYGTAGDVSMSYAVNRRATAILQQPCTKRAYCDRSIPVFGDAVLITDQRYHWVLPQLASSDANFAALDASLTTPRAMDTRRGTTRIVFHVPPHERDISRIRLGW